MNWFVVFVRQYEYSGTHITTRSLVVDSDTENKTSSYKIPPENTNFLHVDPKPKRRSFALTLCADFVEAGIFVTAGLVSVATGMGGGGGGSGRPSFINAAAYPKPDEVLVERVTDFGEKSPTPPERDG